MKDDVLENLSIELFILQNRYVSQFLNGSKIFWKAAEMKLPAKPVVFRNGPFLLSPMLLCLSQHCKFFVDGISHCMLWYGANYIWESRNLSSNFLTADIRP